MRLSLLYCLLMHAILFNNKIFMKDNSSVKRVDYML